MSISEMIASELEALPQERFTEVLDFIRFLKHQEEELFALKAAETALGEYWNTPEEDQAWENL